MAKVNFDTVIDDVLYSLYHGMNNSEARAQKAQTVKDLVIAKVIYERWEKEKNND